VTSSADASITTDPVTTDEAEEDARIRALRLDYDKKLSTISAAENSSLELTAMCLNARVTVYRPDIVDVDSPHFVVGGLSSFTQRLGFGLFGPQTVTDVSVCLGCELERPCTSEDLVEMNVAWVEDIQRYVGPGKSVRWDEATGASVDSEWVNPDLKPVPFG
jgi:hypothetical protein